MQYVRFARPLSVWSAGLLAWQETAKCVDACARAAAVSSGPRPCESLALTEQHLDRWFCAPAQEKQLRRVRRLNVAPSAPAALKRTSAPKFRQLPAVKRAYVQKVPIASTSSSAWAPRPGSATGSNAAMHLRPTTTTSTASTRVRAPCPYVHMHTLLLFWPSFGIHAKN